MAKDFKGYSEHNVDKTPKQTGGGKFTGEDEKNLDRPTQTVPGSSNEAAPGFPPPSKREGGGKGMY